MGTIYGEGFVADRDAREWLRAEAERAFARGWEDYGWRLLIAEAGLASPWPGLYEGVRLAQMLACPSPDGRV